MFESSSVMLWINNGDSDIVKLLEVDKDTQDAICKSFADSSNLLLAEKEGVEFDGSYKPNEDEVLFIKNFNLSGMITDAIRAPLGLETFKKNNDEPIDIKAIFVGERTENDNTEIFTVAFQRFRKEQYLSTKKFSLFFSDDTFIRESRWGIGISDNVDVVFLENNFHFASYYFARQIFDLSEYYRSATDTEVNRFTQNSILELSNSANFAVMADTWVRRKIALINDSGVLRNNAASRIKELADVCELEIEVINNKILIPDDKKKLKEFLGFLDEEIYKGVFTNETYVTNSKRKRTK